ncbi:neprilysin-2-like isoform X2 [Ischnura elegans]|uniref:neprilysin-2-like isoform X2 n=1 Tax=Ischnura elegans TaxID=197161 RepID=UPI001ED89952|nr:neprilysin-2-like isoform X2 [Ischnura elegans]
MEPAMGTVFYFRAKGSRWKLARQRSNPRNPTWWRRRTTMERNLTLIATVAILAAIGLTVALVAVIMLGVPPLGIMGLRDQETSESLPFLAEALVGEPPKDPKENPCLTKGCIKAAAKIIENMDTSVAPCDDFYSYACGGFERKSSIPEDKSSLNAFNVIHDQLQEQLRRIAEEPDQPNDLRAFRMAKDLYRACMNKTLIEERGLEPLKNVLKNLGGWPVLEGDSWDEGSFTWLQSVYKFRKNGYSVDYFLDFSVTIDLKNSSFRTIDLDSAMLGLSREYLTKGLEDKVVKAYYEYQVDIAVLMGADRARASKELKESLNFEIKLANISLPMEQRRNASKLYNPMTVEELQVKYPSIPWMEYFKEVLPPEITVSPKEVVIVNVPQYIKDLEILLSHTPKRVQANYALWRATGASVSYMTEELRRRQLKYLTALSGKTERESRWKECIDTVSGSLFIAMGSQYVRRYFQDDAKKNALEMVEDIRAEFNKILQALDWMDSETRKSAMEKASTMTTHIAYPDELLDDTKVDEFYKKLEVNKDLYLESVLNMTLFGTDFSYRKLRKPVNKTDWVTHGRPAIVNAFYSSIENSIQFPAGILQGVFFSNDRPRYMNYGAIGFVIGHEITHGFDDQGRQFDKDGNLVDWWAPKTKEEYLKKATCIIEQYGNYTLKEVNMNINGINTQGENIADNGGVKEAYRAYEAWEARNGPEAPLPGLDLTSRQLFWVSAANVWCSKYRPEALRLRLLTGYHSPGRYRVIGPFSNSEEFAKDFSCPLGSEMNPTKKCAVW